MVVVEAQRIRDFEDSILVKDVSEAAGLGN